MRKGRKPKAVEQKIQNGTYRPGLHGERSKVSAQFSGAPQVPPTMEDDELAMWMWNRVHEVLPDGMLTASDESGLLLLCRSYSEWVELDACFRLNRYDKDMRVAAQKAKEQFHKISSCFGLNPAEKQRLRIAKDANSDDSDDYFAPKIVGGA